MVELETREAVGSAPWREQLERSLRRRLRLVIGGVAVTFAAALYAADLLSDQGTVARGVVVAGVPIGGLATVDAEAALRAALEARAQAPVVVVAQEFRGALDAGGSGLRIDWAATVDAAAEQPFNPVTRVVSLFSERELDMISDVDDGRLASAVEGLRPGVERPPTEGAVRFEGLEPIPVDPVGGRRLDVAAAGALLRQHWWKGAPLSLPLIEVAPSTSAQDVRRALESFVRPAVAEPVTVSGDGVRATLTREVIASALRLRVDVTVEGRFVPEIDLAMVTDATRRALAPSERPAVDASQRNSSGMTEVVASQDGRIVDYPATFSGLPGVLARGGPDRVLQIVYAVKPPEVTTEELRRSLPPDEMGSFPRVR